MNTDQVKGKPNAIAGVNRKAPGVARAIVGGE